MKFADSFRAARWVRLINLFLQAILFLTLFAGLNYVATNHSWRFDLTQDRRHSLSPETESYLKSLQRPVRVLVTLTEDPDNPEIALAFREISALLREYAYATRTNDPGRIEVEYLDIYRNKRKAEEVGVDKPNLVILVCDGRYRVVQLNEFYRTRTTDAEPYKRESFRGEATLTAAILDVASPEKKRIYFTIGHQERSVESVERLVGLAQLRDELRARNFDVLPLDISVTRKVPDDAALVIVAGPENPFTLFEEEQLRTYLQTRAGRVILMLAPRKRYGLENLTLEWGVQVYNNVVYESASEYQTESGELIVKNFLPHPITQPLIDNRLQLYLGETRVVTEDLGRSPDDGLALTKLIATSTQAWGEVNYAYTRVYTPGEDLYGQLTLLVLSERVKPANLPLSVRGGRLAVLGTADLVTNDRIIRGGNYDLFMGLVNWIIADREISISTRARPIERFQITLSNYERDRLRLGLIFGVPGVVALLGLAVYWTRRK